jgi:hypothetical protein
MQAADGKMRMTDVVKTFNNRHHLFNELNKNGEKFANSLNKKAILLSAEAVLLHAEAALLALKALLLTFKQKNV